jgi:NAD(P) transhydrogenase
MSMSAERYDLIVIGSGPAGQKAAVQGSKAGKRVLVLERDAAVGGECVHRGTIPSKALREGALRLTSLRRSALAGLELELPRGARVQGLMEHLDAVLRAHEGFQARQLERNGIERAQGQARFVSAHEIALRLPRGGERRYLAEHVLIATGSRPRMPADVPVDHEAVLDSDSILSLIYLPESLAILGAGVIACEFASIFQALGVRVTLIDKGARPLAAVDEEIAAGFRNAFEQAGGRFLGGRKHARIELDARHRVQLELDDGTRLECEKLLCALGRMADLRGLELAAAGLEIGPKGFLEVDEHGRTRVPHIYGAGDAIGPPALATAAMEQGRRAARHALGLPEPARSEFMPIGIYTIPELASVGESEAQARARLGQVLVGRARYAELARGAIQGETEGLIKLVADARGERLLGAAICGEGATELVHVAQMALVAGLPVDAFVDNIFNFPTLAEGYRVAALDIAGQRAAALRTQRAA